MYTEGNSVRLQSAHCQGWSEPGYVWEGQLSKKRAESCRVVPGCCNIHHSPVGSNQPGHKNIGSRLHLRPKKQKLFIYWYDILLAALCLWIIYKKCISIKDKKYGDFSQLSEINEASADPENKADPVDLRRDYKLSSEATQNKQAVIPLLLGRIGKRLVS